MDFSNYKSWHIPRASLSSGSNSGQSSADSDRKFNRRHSEDVKTHRKLRKALHDGSLPSSTSSSSSSSMNPKNRHQVESKQEKLHRGSRSSPGSSSDGINSLHSASSLLLSVANLENFTKMQENNSRQLKHGHGWINSTPEVITTAAQNHLVLNIANGNMSENDVIYQHKAKDLDQVSIASSTHFTVVNGFGRSNIKPKSNSVCRQGRQLTILIVTMSILFMIGIIGAIYLMDKRARSMPAYHQ